MSNNYYFLGGDDNDVKKRYSTRIKPDSGCHFAEISQN